MPERLLALLACLAGGLGMAASAAAAHGTGSESLKTAAQFLLFHAPALLAIAALAQGPVLNRTLARAAGFLLALGLALFSGDLALRALLARPLFPMAAPLGGSLLMLGWLAGALAALVPGRRG